MAKNEVVAEKLNSMLARGVRNGGNFHPIREVIQSDDEFACFLQQLSYQGSNRSMKDGKEEGLVVVFRKYVK